MKKILFIGSHLSEKRGTKGISEKIAERLNENFEIMLVSKIENQYLRMLDICLQSLLNNYDIMHIDVFSNKGILYADVASKIAKIRNKKIVMTLRGGMLYKKYNENPNFINKIFKRADVLQTPSLFLKNFFKKTFDIQYMPNFIDLDIFTYNWNIKNLENYNLLWVRGFSEEYRPELAIYALNYILKFYPNANLTMIGPDKGNLFKIKDLVKKLNLNEKVKFLGKIKNEELPVYYHNHSVFLNTTLYESFGVAVMEAAACGIPIVSTPVGEIPFLWEDKKEILLTDDSGNRMGEKIKEIFDNKNLAYNLSFNARKKAEEYDWKKIKNKWLTLFKNL